jgi:hypothetical protein
MARYDAVGRRLIPTIDETATRNFSRASAR